MPPSTSSQPPEAGNAGEGRQQSSSQIDLQALAEEIYKLLQKELRLERERRGWRHIW